MIEERSGYNSRNLPKPGEPPFGPGRIDAFGGILNEVGVRFAQVATNRTVANAPVSYPFLWDAPQHDKVQWNGIAKNSKCSVAKLIKAIGTEDFGAFGRNVGEVIGVFAKVVTDKDPGLVGGYDSTANKTNLVRLEQLLQSLWSPVWPQAHFGKIDTNRWISGQSLYAVNCVGCHRDIVRMDPQRKIIAQMHTVGTDPTMASNVFNRRGKSGVLAGRVVLDPLKELEEEEHLANLLSHIGQRVVLGSSLSDTNAELPDLYSHEIAIPITGGEITASLSHPRFKNGQVVEVLAQGLAVTHNGVVVSIGSPFDLTNVPEEFLAQLDLEPASQDSQTVAAWASYTASRELDRTLLALQAKQLDMSLKESQFFAGLTARQLAPPTPHYSVKPGKTIKGGAAIALAGDTVRAMEADAQLQALKASSSTILANKSQIQASREALRDSLRVTIRKWVLRFGGKPVDVSKIRYTYKARPLNGAWASPPYLHNGSVPDMENLLREADSGGPGERRVSKFRVGSFEYDTKTLGYRTDVGPHEFDTTASPGNSNRGHDHRSGTYKEPFTKEQRAALIEYLKAPYGEIPGLPAALHSR